MKINIDLERLGDFLDGKTCDHTFKYSYAWAANNDVPKEAIGALLNELDVHSDVDLAEIIEDIGQSYEIELEERSASGTWLIPPDFIMPPANKVYHQLIVSPNPSETGYRCYTKACEIIVPAPIDYKPSKKMRKIWHFFVGIDSGLPSEIGIVKSHLPITADRFFEMVNPLAGFEKFDHQAASFYLEQVAKMKIGRGVSVSFIEVFDGSKKFTSLRFSRRLL